jgi:hypothetical protein
MIFKLAAMFDGMLASLNDPILGVLVLPEPEAFAKLASIAAAATAAIVPLIYLHERRRRTIA